MSTFRTALRIVWGHKLYVLIYLVLVDLLGVIMALGVAKAPQEPGAAVIEARPTVAVIDRDGSALSQGVRRFVEGIGEVVDLEDDLRVLQDATAKDRVAYILVIPEGYGQTLMQAARRGEDAPQLERVVSYSSARGALADVRVTSYLQALYGFAATLGSGQGSAYDADVALPTVASPAIATPPAVDESHAEDAPDAGIDQEDVVARADAVMARRVKASYVASQTTTLPESVLIYSHFSTYPLFASITVCLALLMKQLNVPSVRNRMRASALPSAQRSRQLLLACLVVGLFAWAWVCLVGLAVFALPYLGTAPLQLAIVALSLLAYALVAVAIGFLLGQFGVGENASNAIANIGGMVMSFLGGAWVSIDLLPSAVVTAAHLVPSFWCTRAIDGAFVLPEVSSSLVMPLLADIGVATLFALTIFAIAFMVGRRRLQDA